MDDLKLALHLTVKHTAANTRRLNEKILSRHEPELIDSLLQDFEIRFPRWARSLKYAAEMFNEWLQSAMIEKMAALSSQHREDFIEPIQRVGRQLSQLLQDFRYGISEATLATLGVPLRTTEVELAFESPRTPDIRVGKIFDRNWELISLLLPMFAVKGILETHFRRKIRDIVFKNLSRLAFQWEDLVNAGLFQMENEAILRLDNLVSTIEHLLNSGFKQTSNFDQDLAEIKDALFRFTPDNYRLNAFWRIYILRLLPCSPLLMRESIPDSCRTGSK